VRFEEGSSDGGISCYEGQVVPEKRNKKLIKEGVSMIHLGFEEIEKEPRKAMALCSSAIRDAIRYYGFTATLDFVVRISNYDSIVRELLPLFPSLANAVMLEVSNKRPGPKVGQGNTENSIPESESPKTSAG
jgi:hypothetical protein